MKYDIENRIKDTALINLVDFENAIDLYEDGEVEKALELMFGVTTLGLGGKFETDDKEIRRLLKNREYTAEKSNKAYCNKVKTDEEKRIEKLQLKEIAELYGVSKHCISKINNGKSWTYITNKYLFTKRGELVDESN